MKTHDIDSLIQDAERRAGQGCGQSDLLYERRVQAAYATILLQAPDAVREETRVALIARGFDPNYVPDEVAPGQCSLTGIDDQWCPCGRHP